MKDLTVFVMTHNRGKMLIETINSVLNQSCNDFKFIVSDNSNNDETENILKSQNLIEKFEYRKRDIECSGLEHFNICLSEVDTKYFVLFHDDDIMLPEYVENMYNTISVGKYVAVGCNAYKFCNGKRKSLFLQGKNDKKIYSSKELSENYCKYEIAPFPSYIYNKEKIANLKFNNSCGKYSDVIWLQNVSRKGEILWLAKPCMCYRIHAGQDSSVFDYKNQLKLVREFKKCGVSNKIIQKYRCDLLYTALSFKKKRFPTKIFRKYSFCHLYPRTIIKNLLLNLKHFVNLCFSI